MRASVCTLAWVHNTISERFVRVLWFASDVHVACKCPTASQNIKTSFFRKKEIFESENCFQISGIFPNSAINYVQLVLVFWNFFHVDPLGVYEISININCRDPVNIFRRDLFMAGGGSPTPEHLSFPHEQLFLLRSVEIKVPKLSFGISNLQMPRISRLEVCWCFSACARHQPLCVCEN